MRLSIVTVCHKSKGKIARYVETFLQHHANADSAGFEFVFVENSGEADFADSVQPLLMRGFEVKIIYTENEGFGIGCNRGAELATGQLIAFVNPDIEFLTRLDALKNIKKEEWWGTCRQLDGKSRSGGVDIFPECKRTWHEFLGFHRFVNAVPLWFGSYLYVVGSFMVVTSKLFKKSGGFNPAFFLYYEEAELGRRLNQLAGPPMQVSEVEIMHVGFGSHLNKRSIFEHESNGFLTYCRVTEQPWLVKHKIRTLRVVSRFSQGAQIRLEILEKKALSESN